MFSRARGREGGGLKAIDAQTHLSVQKNLKLVLVGTQLWMSDKGTALTVVSSSRVNSRIPYRLISSLTKGALYDAYIVRTSATASTYVYPRARELSLVWRDVLEIAVVFAVVSRGDAHLPDGLGRLHLHEKEGLAFDRRHDRALILNLSCLNALGVGRSHAPPCARRAALGCCRSLPV